MSWITTHHELCHGDECDTWDCASLPENIGQFREGEIVATKDDGSVEIEWTDGTRSTFKLRRAPVDTWVESVRKTGKCRDSMCACQTLNLEETK